MATIAVHDQFADASASASVTHGTLLPRSAPSHHPGQVLRRARRHDAAAIKALFWKLHAFNASLDPHLALAEDWEAHFDAMLKETMCGHEALCLIACEQLSGQTCGFVLAAVHRDSGLWRSREWVEIEGLYVEDAWRGCGLGARLLTRACTWAKHRGLPVVQLYVTATNGQALRFYRQEGFRQTQVILRRVLG